MKVRTRRVTRRLVMAAVCGLFGAGGLAAATATATARPNVIVILADDLGWGDVGYNGNPVVKTPALDRLAEDGVRLDRFYAQAPSCSPTRASALTGRNGHRFGVIRANNGRIEPGERTLAELLSDRGYATGHFGKWHTGTLVEGLRDGQRAGTPRGAGMYSPPWENGFHVSFSTESKVPTWNPMERPDNDAMNYWAPRAEGDDPANWVDYGTRYWIGENRAATQNLDGCDSRIIMDRVEPFVREAVSQGRPFLALVWFHAPHTPVVAGPEFTKLYRGRSEFEQHYFGSITAMDRQIGRLRTVLEEVGAWDDTLLIFGSDNGPESNVHDDAESAPGSAGPLRGKKRSLFEGGVRVPGIASWPAGGLKGGASSLPVTTSDLLPSVRALSGGDDPKAVYPLDGDDVLSLLRRGELSRPDMIPFEFVGQLAAIDNDWKLYSADDGATYALYNLKEDPAESQDVASAHPVRMAAMRRFLEEWRESCRKSAAGADYDARTIKTSPGLE